MSAALKQEEQADRAFAEAERQIAEAVREKMEKLSLAALGLTQLPERVSATSPGCRRWDLKRVFEKFYLGASRLSMRRMAARSMKASEVWTFNS